MVGITVDGVDLGIPSSNFAINLTDSSGGVIFDSGTTHTTLDQTSIDAIVQVCIMFPATECRTMLSPKYLPRVATDLPWRTELSLLKHF
jgi:hypothetical protein